MDDIEARIRKVITEHLGVEAAKVVPAALLEDDLGADSLDLLELAMAAEEEFGCVITDEEAEKAKTVQDVVTLIRSKTK